MTTVFSADWVLPVGAPPVAGGAVAIEDGQIAAVGTQDELGRGLHYPEAVILPGFVNAHSHLEYAVYAGFGDGLPFALWILIHIERKARIGLDEMEAIARLGAAECLASGITTVGDCSFSGAAVTACADLGLRAIVYLEVFGSTMEQLETRFEATRTRVAGSLSRRVQIGISPHAPYTAAPELYRACLELGLPMATHLSESPDEDTWMRLGEGPWKTAAASLPPPPGTSGIRLLAEHGLLHSGTIAAHCVTVDDEEIALLGCGIAPLRRLLDAGLSVGLGTDSPASTPSFNMFDELRAAVFFARARERRPEALGATEALELATLGSARALGLAGEVGSLEPGKRADLVVLSLEGSPFLPWEDPAAAIVLGGSPGRVEATIVGGEVRYERGAFDWQELRQRGTSARDRLLGLPASPGA